MKRTNRLDGMAIMLDMTKRAPIPPAAELNRMVVEWQATRSEKLGNAIVVGVLKLVKATARRYQVRFVGADELFSAALAGVAYAMRGFDVTKGLAFSSYSVIWMRQQILHLLWSAQAVRLPAHLRDLRGRALKAAARLTAQGGPEAATAEAIAAELDEPLHRVVLVLTWDKHHRVVSSDAPVSDDGDLTLIGTFASPIDNPDALADRLMRIRRTRAVIEDIKRRRLTPKQAETFERHILGDETFEEIAASRGVTKQAIHSQANLLWSRIEAELRERLAAVA